MRNLLVVSCLLLSCCAANAAHSQLRVAVIDTGIAANHLDKNFLCPTGHKDFTNTSIIDAHGHGTHISGLIDQNAKNIKLTLSGKNSDAELLNKIKLDYCQIVIKFYHLPSQSAYMNEALEYAISLKPDIINISAGGDAIDYKEQFLIKKALRQGIVIVNSAGNNAHLLKQGVYTWYPAMYDKRIVVVGNGLSQARPASTSNYGPPISVWEDGERQVSLGLSKTCTMSGTSQSAAIFTGKLVKFILQKRRR